MVAISLLPLLAGSLSVGVVTEPPQGRSVYVEQALWDANGNDPLQSLVGERTTVAPVGNVPGYVERDRDVGQIFTAPATREPFRLTSITFRVSGFQSGAVGAGVSLQLLKVGGWPAAHDNKTRHEKVVAWTDDPRADDYLTGETYATLGVFSGGKLPTDLREGGWLRFGLRDAPILRPGEQYAFLILFDRPALLRSLTPSGVYWGDYPGGHAIRREGSVAEGWSDPNPFAPGKERLPASWKVRLAQPPSVWGRPNVDTWRDLCFFVEGEPWYGG